MNKVDFTVFLNSRGRAEQLSNFISLLQDRTSNHGRTELIITCDDDDDESKSVLKNTSTRLKFVPIIGPRPANLCSSYNNMARMATGRYLLVMNDDAEILTQGWDFLAMNAIAKFQINNGIKDDIVFGDTSDTSVDKPSTKHYPSFPIISKQAVNVLGYFMDERFVGLGGDSSIYRIYSETSRIVDLSFISIDHIYHNAIFKVMSPDKTASEMRRNSAQNFVDPFTINVESEIQKLKTFISNANK